MRVRILTDINSTGAKNFSAAAEVVCSIFGFNVVVYTLVFHLTVLGMEIKHP